MTEEEVFIELKGIFVESFLLEENDIKRESDFFEDLDFDSIDLIDLVAKIHNKTGKQLNPEQFRDFRTVGDAVSIVVKISEESDGKPVE